MLYNSYAFLFAFLPLVLVVHFAAFGRANVRRGLAWLAIASLAFYGYWNPRYLLLIAASILFNFTLGHFLGRLYAAEAPLVRRKRWATFGIAANLSLLGYYKYAAFFVQIADDTFGTHVHMASILLPLGISFFTFEQIGYLVDAFRGHARSYSFVEYCFFVTFFPHLIAGPIIVHSDLLEQVSDAGRYRLDANNFATGLTLFVFGLAKKVLVADTFASYGTQAFLTANGGQVPHALEAWLCVWAYALQLYFDFSGYSDMGLGLSLMLNFKLPLNFNSPYKSANIIDFWRRWHLTLSRFLRESIYIPLGGNRAGELRKNFNLFMTMLLGGLWHGAGWTFIVWGALHGSMLVLNHAWRRMAPKAALSFCDNSWLGRELCVCLTMLCVLVGWVFFRAPSFAAATRILQGMWGAGGAVPVGALAAQRLPVGLCVLGYLFCRSMPNTQQLLAQHAPALGKIEPSKIGQWPQSRWAASVVALLAWASILNFTKVSEFLYFQF